MSEITGIIVGCTILLFSCLVVLAENQKEIKFTIRALDRTIRELDKQRRGENDRNTKTMEEKQHQDTQN